ncbi:hypothetical protein [Absidia glauca]|uniref:Kinesin motor domain-containing protein n=1 Tax=Absidia glauca TaxID=4829 RepID=A0A168SUU5_ABSGL|nr:hypothetical protein [Absidia glauca]
MPNKEDRLLNPTVASSLQVALRLLPVPEQALHQDDCLKVMGNTVRLLRHNKLYHFDHVFGSSTPQNAVFTTYGMNLVQKYLEGHNVTVLAYGQTSSGKSCTIDEGILPGTIAHLFDTLAGSSLSSTVKVSYIELQNEQLNDLLNEALERPNLSIREDAKGQIHWTGVKEMDVHNVNDVLFYLKQGTKQRSMNTLASRSHCIFSVILDSSLEKPRSKFHFVDLASSERVKQMESMRRKEGITINTGLHALGNVLSALNDPSRRDKHIPYRDSKLTRLLRDSLTTTLMIACVNPLESTETHSTLNFTNRARNHRTDWEVTTNVELLRSLVGKLKHRVRTLKSASSGSLPMHEHVTKDTHDDDGDDDSCDRTTLESLRQSYHHLQIAYDEQEQAISDLHLRLTKTLSCQTNNIAYIDELELKLQQITDEATQFKADMNQQRNLVAKWKQDRETTEHYIQRLEQQLDEEKRTSLATTSALHHLKNDLRHAAYEENTALKDQVEALEKDRDAWKRQTLQQQQQQQGDAGASLQQHMDSGPCDTTNDTHMQQWEDSGPHYATNTTHIQKLMDSRPCDTTNGTHIQQGDPAPPSTTNNAHLLYLEELGNTHRHALAELDVVFQQYNETLEQLDNLDHTSVLESIPPPSSYVSQPSFTDDDDDDDALSSTGLQTPPIHGPTLAQELSQALDRCKVASLETQVHTIQETLVENDERWHEQRMAVDHLKHGHHHLVARVSCLENSPWKQDMAQQLLDKDRIIKAQAARILYLESQLPLL